MIQRIQTLFLILALICMSLFFFLPFGKIITAAGEIVPLGIYGCDYIDENGNPQHFSAITAFILIAGSSAITLISIFLFKKRILQMRFNIFNIVLQIGSIALMFLLLYQASNAFGVDYSTSFLIVVPIAAAILTFLAIRAIARDEALVRSLDRIR